MPDLLITHRPGRGNRITRANRRQIYKFLQARDPGDVGQVTVRVQGRMQDHKTREKLLLLTEEFNSELAARDLMWRLKALQVRFLREGEFTCADLHARDVSWSKRLLKRGLIDLIFGAVSIADL